MSNKNFRSLYAYAKQVFGGDGQLIQGNIRHRFEQQFNCEYNEDFKNWNLDYAEKIIQFIATLSEEGHEDPFDLFAPKLPHYSDFLDVMERHYNLDRATLKLPKKHSTNTLLDKVRNASTDDEFNNLRNDVDGRFESVLYQVGEPYRLSGGQSSNPSVLLKNNIINQAVSNHLGYFKKKVINDYIHHDNPSGNKEGWDDLSNSEKRLFLNQVLNFISFFEEQINENR